MIQKELRYGKSLKEFVMLNFKIKTKKNVKIENIIYIYLLFGVMYK